MALSRQPLSSDKIAKLTMNDALVPARRPESVKGGRGTRQGNRVKEVRDKGMKC